MIRRCEPPRRRYTELCNRSSSSAMPRPALPQMYNADEDYWEDASVSLRSRHSWEAPSSTWLDASSPQPMSDAHDLESKSSCDSVSHYVRPCRYSFDASHDYLGSPKGRRCFPPPLASCSTLSIKEGGRFVLKEMDADRPQGFFRAQRENGRLVLQLVLPDEVNDDTIPAEEDGGIDHDDDDGCGEETDNDDDDVDEDNPSVVEYAADCRAGLHDKGVHVEYDVHNAEFLRRDCADCTSSGEDVTNRKALDGLAGGVIGKECESACQTHVSECATLDDASSLCDELLRDDGSEIVEFSACSAGQDASKEGGSWDYGVGQLVAESRFGKEQISRDVCGHQHQESLWNVDTAMSSRSPWSANQMCLHQSLINMRPALGLAMS